MNKTFKTFAESERESFLLKMLNWAMQFNIFCFLHSGNGSFDDGFPNLLAVGAKRMITPQSDEQPFQQLEAFHREKPGWVFGHFNYELNTGLPSRFPNEQGFPDCCFFEPLYLFRFSADGMEILLSDEPADDWLTAIVEGPLPNIGLPQVNNIHNRITKAQYLRVMEHIRNHLKRGDCYEINFCQAFFAHAKTDPLGLFKTLTHHSPNPFSAFYKYEQSYAVCASPERFLKKTGNTLLSQPIKGTSPRFEDEEKDRLSKAQLESSSKDRSENVMVVDLVRHDLSRVCLPGSVQVPELFSVQSFPGVHQMISSITGTMRPGLSFADALEVAFPMGSMTGAPKQRVMELINQYEFSRRGLFSGSIGYITPEADFDFNVVIRTLFYHEGLHQLSFQAGGGITYYSEAEKEYDESLLKTQAIRKILSGEEVQ